MCSQTTEVSRRPYSQSAAVALSQNLWLHRVVFLTQAALTISTFQLKLGRRARQLNERVVKVWFDILSMKCSLSFVNVDGLFLPWNLSSGVVPSQLLVLVMTRSL